MLVGAVVKIGTNWVLVGQPEININGAPIGTCLCYFIIMALNLAVILRTVRPAPKLARAFLRPLAASLIMAAAAWGVNGLAARVMPEKLAVLVAIAVAVAVYAALVVLLRAITREDALLLPKGEKIANLLRLR